MPRTRTSSGAELLVELRRDDPTPLHRQLEQELRTAIRSGRLEANAALPSSRTLADQLGLSRGVVVGASEQLIAGGFLPPHPAGRRAAGGRQRVPDDVAPGDRDRRRDASDRLRLWPARRQPVPAPGLA